MILLVIRPALALDASEFPQQLADQLNLPLFAGQLICSTIILLMVLLPLNAVCKKERALPNLILGLPTLGVLIAIGWFPVFLLLILCMLVALLYGKKMGEILGGH